MSESMLAIVVNGVVFKTKKEWLVRKEGYLKWLVENKKSTLTEGEERFEIKKNPTHFKYMLDFVRNGFIDFPKSTGVIKEILDAAKNYGYDDLVKKCEEKMLEEKREERRIQHLAKMVGMTSPTAPIDQKINGKSRIPEQKFNEFVFNRIKENPDTTMWAELQYKTPYEGSTCSLHTFLNFARNQKYEYSKWFDICKEIRDRIETLMKHNEDEERDSAENKPEEVTKQNENSQDTNLYSVHVRPVRADNREEVREIMKQNGTICRFYHRNTTRYPSADFAFITYTTEEAQKRALNARRVSDNQDGWLLIKTALKPENKCQPTSTNRQNFCNNKQKETKEEEWRRDNEANEEYLWMIF
ncbi:hypothetical protein CRE_22708 [Caenorhabditis remanei]|uniref:BTB domain-containing protein n=1 Tax=Caenorhabditis remanei TaxID=31234 RepID=E3NJT8_CAERE|nr:hypothetical protein CRE_22708 [Caenorhabditis remanei]